MQAFDKIAREWNENRQAPISPIPFFLKFVRKDDRILDAGCGNGRNLVEIARNCGEAYGMDSSTEMVNFCRENLMLKGTRNAGCLAGNIMGMPFSDGFFDKVFSAAVIHHLGKQEQPLAVKEFFRVLKRSGSVFATVWAENRLKEGNEGHVKWGEVQRYHYFYKKGELEELFRDAGFDVTELFFERNGKRVPEEEGQNIVLIAKKP
ncbi:MAG: class I SAM-dependent methyltransferase [Candidatus Micrarchaeota archaeon]